jgi:hypothetical protein
MKLFKLLLAATFLVSGLANAQSKGYVRFEYYDEENVVTKAENMAYAVVPGIVIDKKWDFSAQFRSVQPEFGNGALSNSVEARVTRLFEVGSLKPYVSLRTGSIIKANEDFMQYNVVAGTRFPIAGALVGDVGVRYRNAYDTSHNFQTTRPHFGLLYGLTKQDIVGVRFARSYGDSEVNQWRVTYQRNF